MKYLLLTKLALAMGLLAQKKHEVNDRIHSLNWDIIAGVKFNMDEDFNNSPVFPETIKRFKYRPF